MGIEKFKSDLGDLGEELTTINDSLRTMRNLSKKQMFHGLSARDMEGFNKMHDRSNEGLESLSRRARKFRKEMKDIQKELSTVSSSGMDFQTKKLTTQNLETQIKGYKNTIKGIELEQERIKGTINSIRHEWRAAADMAQRYNRVIDRGRKSAKQAASTPGVIRSGSGSRSGGSSRRKEKGVVGTFLGGFSRKTAGLGGFLGGLSRMGRFSPLGAVGLGALQIGMAGFQARKDVELRGSALRQRGLSDVFRTVDAGRFGMLNANDTLSAAQSFMRRGGVIDEGRMTRLGQMSRGFGLDATQLAEVAGSMAGAQGVAGRSQTNLPNIIGKAFGTELNKWGADMPMILENLQSVTEDLNGTLSSVSESNQVALVGFQKALLNQDVSTKAVPQIMSNALQSIISPQNNLMKTMQLEASGFFGGESGMLKVINQLADGGSIDEETKSMLNEQVTLQKGFLPGLIEASGLIAEKSQLGIGRLMLERMRERTPALTDLTRVRMIFPNLSREAGMKVLAAMEKGISEADFKDLLEGESPIDPIKEQFKEFKGTMAGYITNVELVAEQTKLLAGTAGFAGLKLSMDTLDKAFNKLTNSTGYLGDIFVTIENVLKRLGFKTGEERKTPSSMRSNRITGGLSDIPLSKKYVTKNENISKIEEAIQKKRDRIQELKEKQQRDLGRRSDLENKVMSQFGSAGFKSPTEKNINRLQESIKRDQDMINRMNESFNPASMYKMIKPSKMEGTAPTGKLERESAEKPQQISQDSIAINITVNGNADEDVIRQIGDATASSIRKAKNRRRDIA